jgi:hypothetical protein
MSRFLNLQPFQQRSAPSLGRAISCWRYRCASARRVIHNMSQANRRRSEFYVQSKSWIASETVSLSIRHNQAVPPRNPSFPPLGFFISPRGQGGWRRSDFASAEATGELAATKKSPSQSGKLRRATHHRSVGHGERSTADNRLAPAATIHAGDTTEGAISSKCWVSKTGPLPIIDFSLMSRFAAQVVNRSCCELN